MAHDLGIPAHIAVIPSLAQAELTDTVRSSSALIPLVHGWAHKNHALPDAKKSEFGQPRADAKTETSWALERMRALFQDAFLPIFVPPWNRIDATLIEELSAIGYLGLSTFSPRKASRAAPGLVQINAHIDPIDWRGTRDLIEPEVIVAQTADILQRRLRRELDSGEPLGFLSHHLVHSDAVWSFSHQFLSELLLGGAEAQPLTPLLETSE